MDHFRDHATKLTRFLHARACTWNSLVNRDNFDGICSSNFRVWLGWDPRLFGFSTPVNEIWTAHGIQPKYDQFEVLWKIFYYDESEVNWSTGSSILSETILYLISRARHNYDKVRLSNFSWVKNLDQSAYLCRKSDDDIRCVKLRR